MLDQKRVAHQLEQVGSVSRGLSQPCEFAGERLDGIEDVGDLPFVAPENDALGERVRYHQQPFQREFPDHNRAADRDRLFGFLGDLYLRPLLFGRRDLAVAAGLQSLEKLRLLRGRQTNEHRHAITEQHGQSIRPDAHRQGRTRQHLTLEAGRIDAVADQKRVRGQLLGRRIGRS